MKLKIIVFMLLLQLVLIAQEDLLLKYSESAGNPELVTNGTFSTATDWSTNGGWSISGGVAVSNNASGYNVFYQDIGLVGSTTYEYSFDITGYTSGECRLYYHNGSYQLIQSGMASIGSYSGEFTTSGIPNGTVYIRCNDGFIGSGDNLSIKEK